MADDFEKKEGEKMKSFTMRMPPSLIEAAQERAGLIPLSVVIRTLVEMWLRGEIDLKQSGKK
jgi:hypothetical protein